MDLMNSVIAFIEQHWRSLVLPISVAGITLLLGFSVRNSVFRRLRRWTTASSSKFDEVVIEGIRGPFMIWVLMLSLYLGVQTSRLPARAQDISAEALLVLFVFSMTLVCSRLAGASIKFHTGAVTSLAENLVRLAIFLLGGMIIMDTL